MKLPLHLLAVIAVCTVALGTPRAMAQESGAQAPKKAFSDYLALRTNLVEWAVAVPNISLSTDLSAKPWGRSTAGITLKYKWPTRETFAPSLQLNLLEVRPEYRYYGKKLYFGAYAAYNRFTTRLPSWPSAWKGDAVGGGLSAGWEIPLYQYGKSALDLDLGLSVGAHYARRQEYDAGSASLCPEVVRGILPYPELRVALTWRRTSVKDKYRGLDPMDGLYRNELESIRMNFDATNRENFDALHTYRLKAYQSSVFLDLFDGDVNAYRYAFEEYLQESFVDVAMDNIKHSRLDERSKKRLGKKVEQLRRKALAAFDKSLAAEKK